MLFPLLVFIVSVKQFHQIVILISVGILNKKRKSIDLHVTHVLILMTAGLDLHLKFNLNGIVFN